MLCVIVLLCADIECVVFCMRLDVLNFFLLSNSSVDQKIFVLNLSVCMKKFCPVGALHDDIKGSIVVVYVIMCGKV